MDDLTVIEWLKKEELNEEEIDFLLTFIPNISVIKLQPTKAVVIWQSMNKQFPIHGQQDFCTRIINSYV